MFAVGQREEQCISLSCSCFCSPYIAFLIRSFAVVVRLFVIRFVIPLLWKFTFPIELWCGEFRRWSENWEAWKTRLNWIDVEETRYSVILDAVPPFDRYVFRWSWSVLWRLVFEQLLGALVGSADPRLVRCRLGVEERLIESVSQKVRDGLGNRRIGGATWILSRLIGFALHKWRGLDTSDRTECSRIDRCRPPCSLPSSQYFEVGVEYLMYDDEYFVGCVSVWSQRLFSLHKIGFRCRWSEWRELQ